MSAPPAPSPFSKPAAWVRVPVRFSLLAVVTVWHYALFLLTRPLARVRPEWGSATRVGVRAAWARSVAWCMGMRLEVLGRAPVGPFFLVANHLSYMDIVALLATTPATFLSKAEVARWPLVGWLARSTGTLFVDRTKKSDLVRVLGAIRGSLSAGQGVVVFPEGTSSEGRDVLPFRPSIFEVPAMLGIPVRCATLTYRTPPGSAPANLAVCWWGDMAFFPHLLALLALPRFEVTVSFGTQELYEADRKRLAERARAAVLSEFRPVVGAC